MPINIQDYLLGRIPVGRKIDIPAYLMAKAASGGIQEISGTLPLAVRSRALQVLKNYIIYGTASGAGVETENLFEGTDITGSINNTIYKNDFVYANLSQGTYTLSFDLETTATSNYASSIGVGETAYSKDIQIQSGKSDGNFTFTFTIDAENAGKNLYARFARFSTAVTITYTASNIMLIPGSTAPSSYIPHGYKLPLKVTSNGTTTDYPVYIGDSQLGEEEYVDYESGKIYKMVDGTLTPTDPPVPLPDISLPQGEVTIDTEEELKPQATIKGNITQIT